MSFRDVVVPPKKKKLKIASFIWLFYSLCSQPRNPKPVFNPIHRLNQDIFQVCPPIMLRNLFLIATMSLNVTSSSSLQVNWRNVTTRPAVLFILVSKLQTLITWVEKKRKRDSWGFTVNVAWDQERYSYGLSKIGRKGPKDRVWEAL